MRPPGTENPEAVPNGRTRRIEPDLSADRYRLALAGAAFAGGALFAGYVNVLFLWLFALGWVAIALAALLWTRFPSRRVAALAATLAAVFLVGAATLRAGAPLFPIRDAPSPPSRLARIQGIVDGKPSRSATHRVYTRFPIRMEKVATADGWRPASNRVRVSVVGDLDVRYGDRVKVLCLLHPIPPPENPGAVDFRPAFYAQRIEATAHAPSPGCVQVVEQGQGARLWRAAFAARARVRELLDETMEPRAASLARRLLVGEADALAWRHRRPFVETGTVHFLAVSGLHVGILAWFCWAVLAAAGVGRKAAALAVVATLVVFAMLTGMRPPVVRAVLMASLACFAFVFGRKTWWPSAIACAAVVILLVRPADILAPGFQLSFVAVLGILTLTLPIVRGLVRGLFPEDPFAFADPGPVWPKGAARALLCVCTVSVAAWVATLPFTAGQFRRIVPIAPLVSVFMLPVVWAFLVTAFPGVLLSMALPAAGTLLLRIAESAADAMFAIGEAGSSLPGASMNARPWPWWWTAAFYGLLVLFAARERTGLPLRRCVLVCVAVLCAAVWMDALRPVGGATKLVSLDIRDGHATILRTPEGGVILYGAGDRSGFRAGQDVINALLWLGARRVDLAVLPNGLASYGNALAEVAEAVPVRRVVAARNALDHPGGRLSLYRFESMGVPVELVDARHELGGVRGARIRVLFPPPNIGRFAPLGPRDALCALEIRTGDTRVTLAPEAQPLARRVLASTRASGEIAPFSVPTPCGVSRGATVVTWEDGRRTVRSWPGGRVVSAPDPPDPALYRRLPGVYNRGCESKEGGAEGQP